MIPDFNTYIKESIWTDIHRRSNGTQTRKEDSYNFNIDKLEEVDLGPEFPILFADTDLVVNNELYFDWDQVENMLPQIKNTGWRLPLGPYEMKLIIKLILKLDHISTEFKDSTYGMIKNEKTGEYVSFATPTKYGETYWCEDDYSGPYSPYASMDNQRVFEVGNNYYQGSRKMVLLATNNLEKTKLARIRLVKDKEFYK